MLKCSGDWCAQVVRAALLWAAARGELEGRVVSGAARGPAGPQAERVPAAEPRAHDGPVAQPLPRQAPEARAHRAGPRRHRARRPLLGRPERAGLEHHHAHARRKGLLAVGTSIPTAHLLQTYCDVLNEYSTEYVSSVLCRVATFPGHTGQNTGHF